VKTSNPVVTDVPESHAERERFSQWSAARKEQAMTNDEFVATELSAFSWPPDANPKYVHIYIYMHACKYIYIHVYVNTCMYICMYPRETLGVYGADKIYHSEVLTRDA